MNDTDFKLFGSYLRSIRSSSSITMNVISDRTGMNVLSIGRIEQDRALPRITSLRVLEDAYGIVNHVECIRNYVLTYCTRHRFEYNHVCILFMVKTLLLAKDSEMSSLLGCPYKYIITSTKIHEQNIKLIKLALNIDLRVINSMELNPMELFDIAVDCFKYYNNEYRAG